MQQHTASQGLTRSHEVYTVRNRLGPPCGFFKQASLFPLL
jgi:hypothetical protein